MKLGCFQLFILMVSLVACVGKAREAQMKVLVCVSTHLIPQPAGLPTCPTNSAQKLHVQTIYQNQTPVVAISAT